MKYLDEFRDSAKAGFLLKEIKGLVASLSIPDDRPLHFMEVCGGHPQKMLERPGHPCALHPSRKAEPPRFPEQ